MRIGPPVGGQTVLLVAGECEECKWRVAVPEGDVWPACPECGEQVMPPSHQTDWLEGNDRSGYAATYFSREADAIQRVAEMEKKRHDFLRAERKRLGRETTFDRVLDDLEEERANR